MAKRHYSDADRAVALAVYDSTADQAHRLRDAARKAGVPESTFRRWLADRDRAAPADLRAQKSSSLAALIEQVARRAVGLTGDALGFLESLPDEERGREALDHLSELNRVAGTAIDKHQLLSGGATDRVETRVTIDLSSDAQGPDDAGDE